MIITYSKDPSTWNAMSQQAQVIAENALQTALLYFQNFKSSFKSFQKTRHSLPFHSMSAKKLSIPYLLVVNTLNLLLTN